MNPFLAKRNAIGESVRRDRGMNVLSKGRNLNVPEYAWHRLFYQLPVCYWPVWFFLLKYLNAYVRHERFVWLLLFRGYEIPAIGGLDSWNRICVKPFDFVTAIVFVFTGCIFTDLIFTDLIFTDLIFTDLIFPAEMTGRLSKALTPLHIQNTD